MSTAFDPVTAIANTVNNVIDKIFPDADSKEKAKVELAKLQMSGELQQEANSIATILAEANSADPWTSRARPSFMYVMYVMILAAIPMGIVFAFAPEHAERVTNGVNKWLSAIPEPMWWLFGAGYLGYTATRSFDKWKGVAR